MGAPKLRLSGEAVASMKLETLTIQAARAIRAYAGTAGDARGPCESMERAMELAAKLARELREGKRSTASARGDLALIRAYIERSVGADMSRSVRSETMRQSLSSLSMARDVERYCIYGEAG